MKKITIHDKHSLPAGQSITAALQRQPESGTTVEGPKAPRPTPYRTIVDGIVLMSQ